MVVLSVDPVEAAIWRAGVGRDQPTGLAAYVVIEVVALAQLSLGHDVIVDAVNDAEPAGGAVARAGRAGRDGAAVHRGAVLGRP